MGKMPELIDYAVYFAIFVTGVVIGRITMAVQAAAMKKQAKR